MEPWAWLVAYICGFALLQLLLYRYFRRELSGTESTTPGSYEARGSVPRSSPEEVSEGGQYCQHCGAFNDRDPAYTFCRECARPL